MNEHQLHEKFLEYLKYLSNNKTEYFKYHYSIWCIRRVGHLMRSSKCMDFINVAESYSFGKKTEIHLNLSFFDAKADCSGGGSDNCIFPLWNRRFEEIPFFCIESIKKQNGKINEYNSALAYSEKYAQMAYLFEIIKTK